jgi:hypothetical protein
MLAFGIPLQAVSWTAWVALAAGLMVMAAVISGGVMYGRWRRRRRPIDVSWEEDLAWDQLLSMIEKHNRDRAEQGLPPDDISDELLNEMVAKLPSLPDARPVEQPEDREFQLSGGIEKRAGKRRWGNPTEIQIRSYLWTGDVHGIVVNRSTGGLGIYTDKEVPLGTPLRVRAVEAPASIPVARAEVRHSRRIGRGYFLGCKFVDEVPWNVRVWFG